VDKNFFQMFTSRLLRPWPALVHHGHVMILISLNGAVPGQRRAANGVTHRHEERRDTYDLPAGTDGVAQSITVDQRPWWRGGAKAEARDAAGHLLEATAYKHEVYVVDAASGITTRLNRDTLDLEVSAKPRISSSTMPGASDMTWQTDMQETLAADGTVTVRTNRETHHLVPWASIPTAAAGAPVLLSDRYEETVIAPGALPATRVLECEQQGPLKAKATLSATVDQSGLLTIVDAAGAEHAHPLLIPLHAMETPSI